MPELFKDWFCLKNRESFTIDPKINSSDARFYFGRAPLEARLKLEAAKKRLGWGDRDDIQTWVDLHEAEEGRTPRGESDAR